jgi:translation elongation factor EF-1alpha
MCHIHADIVHITLDRLLDAVKPHTEKNPKLAKADQMVNVILRFERPVCIETFSAFPQLERFLLRYEGAKIAVSLV